MKTFKQHVKEGHMQAKYGAGMLVLLLQIHLKIAL